MDSPIADVLWRTATRWQSASRSPTYSPRNLLQSFRRPWLSSLAGSRPLDLAQDCRKKTVVDAISVGSCIDAHYIQEEMFMRSTLKLPRISLAFGTLFGLLGAGMASIAAASPVVIELPAGLACADFGLRVEVTASPHRVYREFVDNGGNVVRILTAGRGNALVFTNLSTGAKLSLKPNGGSVEHIVNNSDGSQTWMTTGHNVLILFPTDVPPGPSTTLYVGEVVFTVDTGGVFTLEDTNGRSTDICAVLSQ